MTQGVPHDLTTIARPTENVAKKRICVLSNLFASIWDPFNLSNVGIFSWNGLSKDLIQVQKEKGKFVVVYLRPP